MIDRLDENPRRRRRWAVVAALGCLLVAGPALAAAGVFQGDAQVSSGRSLSSVSCSESGTSAAVVAPSRCVLVLSDGRRFSCPQRFVRGTPTASTVEHAKACTRLTPLAIPASSRRVFAAIERVRSCLIGRGLRVLGGPSLGLPGGGRETPLGELIVANGTAPTFLAFYANSQAARRAEPRAIQTAKRLGGRVARRGAVITLWTRPPASTPASSSLGLCLDQVN